jgi:starvation-inducible DNA-binding protein
MIDHGHQINCFNRRIMAQAILRVLAETGMLAMKTQGVWWSLQGPAFALLDKSLEEQRQDLLDAMTPLARRMKALGSSIFIDYAVLTAHARTVVPQSRHISLSETLRGLSQDHRTVADVIRCARILAATLDDKATLSLLDPRLLVHESAVTHLEDFVLGLGDEPGPSGSALDEVVDSAERSLELT